MQSSSQIDKPTTNFLPAGCPSCRPSNSVTAVTGLEKYAGCTNTESGDNSSTGIPDVFLCKEYSSYRAHSRLFPQLVVREFLTERGPINRPQPTTRKPKSAFYSTGYTLTRGSDRTSQVILQHFPGTFVNFSMTLQDLVWRVLKVTPEKIRETFTQIQLTTLSGDFINIGSSTEYATGDERHSEHVSLLSKVFTPTVFVLS